MMKAKVTDYTFENDSTKTVHRDIIEVDVNVKKTGPDVDVINAWIRDEYVWRNGTDFLPDFTVINMDELIEAAKAAEPTGQVA